MVAEPWLIPHFKLLDDRICAELLAFITQNDPAPWDLPLQLVLFGLETRRSWYSNTSDDGICNESLRLTEQHILDLEGRYLAAIRCFEYILDSAYDATRVKKCIIGSTIGRIPTYEKQPSRSTRTKSPVRNQPSSTNASRVAFSSFQ
jgi:hypothetical protein